MKKTWILAILGAVVAYMGYRVFFAKKASSTSSTNGSNIATSNSSNIVANNNSGTAYSSMVYSGNGIYINPITHKTYIDPNFNPGIMPRSGSEAEGVDPIKPYLMT